MSSSTRARHRSRLTAAFVLVLGFMVVETAAGLLTGSLALLSDAGHMASDALALGMALAAVTAAQRSTSEGRRTFGLYRLEIIAALANAALLVLVAGYVIWEAGRRFAAPVEFEVGPVLVVGLLGLGVNLVAWQLLRPGAAESLNVEAASLEVVADLLGSIGVIAAALITLLTGWPYADPLFAALIGLFILPRAWRLGGEAVRILVQAAPPHVDLGELHGRLTRLPGVVDVHDLHVWTLTSDMEVASAHVMVEAGQDLHQTLDQAREMLRRDFRIDHATLQVEPDTHEGCADVTW